MSDRILLGTRATAAVLCEVTRHPNAYEKAGRMLIESNAMFDLHLNEYNTIFYITRATHGTMHGVVIDLRLVEVRRDGKPGFEGLWNVVYTAEHALHGLIAFPPHYEITINELSKRSPESQLSTEKRRLREGLCPKCGLPGEFRLMALVCHNHGPFAGC